MTKLQFLKKLNFSPFSPYFRYHPWIYPPTLQNELPGSQVLLFSWRTSDANVTDAGVTAYHLQSCHRYHVQCGSFLSVLIAKDRLEKQAL